MAKPLVSCLFESVNPPKLNIQEVQGGFVLCTKGRPRSGTHLSGFFTFVKSHHWIWSVFVKKVDGWHCFLNNYCNISNCFIFLLANLQEKQKQKNTCKPILFLFIIFISYLPWGNLSVKHCFSKVPSGDNQLIFRLASVTRHWRNLATTAINTGASPFSFSISVLGSFMCITQHTGPTALRPIRRTKQL